MLKKASFTQTTSHTRLPHSNNYYDVTLLALKILLVLQFDSLFIIMSNTEILKLTDQTKFDIV